MLLSELPNLFLSGKKQELNRECICYVCTKLLQLCPTLTPWTVAHQAPLSMGFSRQEYWSGLPCPPRPLGREDLSCVSYIGKQVLYD